MIEGYLGIDIGSTNIKAGVCDAQGRLLALKSCPTGLACAADGIHEYDPKHLLEGTLSLLEQLIHSKNYCIRGIGIAGMAETTLALSRETGELVSPLHSWKDMRSQQFAQQQLAAESERDGFFRTGLHCSYKYSVFKAAALQQAFGNTAGKLRFLQVVSYLAWELTGEAGVDETLALRTFAWNLGQHCYDAQVLERFRLEKDAFPAVLAQGQPVGCLRKRLQQRLRCGAIPVYLAGHDHIAAATAVGVTGSGDLLLSLGTTGIALGSFAQRRLTERDYHCGYSYGLHTRQGQMTWQGGLQAAGASLDWCCRLLGLKDYCALKHLLATQAGRVGELTFLPYLNGSGAPKLDPAVRGMLQGLSMATGPAQLAYGVVEGICYELKHLLAQAPVGRSDALKVVGGATNNEVWMQTLANVLGCVIKIPSCKQATLTGAAMAAAGGGLMPAYDDEKSYLPQLSLTQGYAEKYNRIYMPMQQAAEKYKQK